MNNILFPTDFSELSLNAFSFALEYAHKMGHKIIVFHAYDKTIEHNYLLKSVYKDVNIDNYKDEKKPFPPIENLIKKKYADLKVKYVVREGKFIDAITQYVEDKEDKIDTIIMATDDRNRFIEIFVEAKTLKVIEEVNKPVIAIPEKTNFDGTLDNMAFLVDYKEAEKAPLVDLIEKAKEFNAKLHVIHFDLAHGESISPLMNKFKQTFIDNDFNNVEFITIDSIDIKESLKEYCNKNNIDMVCLMNHRKNFYQRLFTQSLAEDLIKNLNTPIMAIYHD